MIQALTNVRALRALNMRRHGVRLADISKEFGVTKERARQLSKLGLELERRMAANDPWFELRPRIRNALTHEGCTPTPDGVVEHFKTHDWKRTVAFGIVCFTELNAWLVRHGKEPLK